MFPMCVCACVRACMSACVSLSCGHTLTGILSGTDAGKRELGEEIEFHFEYVLPTGDIFLFLNKETFY